MKKEKHIPYRTCAGCRKKDKKDELVRIVISEGVYTYDENKILPGRGVYLCNFSSCYEAALKKHRIGKVVNMPKETDV